MRRVPLAPRAPAAARFRPPAALRRTPARVVLPTVVRLRVPRGPPSCLTTVTHPVRAAAFAERMRRFAALRILRAPRFVLRPVERLSRPGMNSSSLVVEWGHGQHVPYRARSRRATRDARSIATLRARHEHEDARSRASDARRPRARARRRAHHARAIARS